MEGLIYSIIAILCIAVGVIDIILSVMYRKLHKKYEVMLEILTETLPEEFFNLMNDADDYEESSIKYDELINATKSLNNDDK